MEREISTIRIECDWLQKALPEGMPYPTSTLISGPGGTGKPLVEFAFVASNTISQQLGLFSIAVID